MTRGDLISRIIGELHLETASYTVQVIDAINSAVAFYRPQRFWFTEGTTDLPLGTQGSVVLSSEFPDSITFDNVRIADDSGTFVPITQQNWADFQLHESMTALPTHWALHHGLLHVWPYNNSTRTLQVDWHGLMTMTACDSSSCVWTNEAEELIRLHAKVDLCENFLQDLPAADRHRGREGTVLNQLVTETINRLGLGDNMRSYL
jgi:hypothetical protein